MGRGRQKAKQTKVARELKYHSSSIDVTALQRELSSTPGAPVSRRRATEVDDDPYAEDPYAAYSYDDEDDERTGRYA